MAGVRVRSDRKCGRFFFAEVLHLFRGHYSRSGGERCVDREERPLSCPADPTSNLQRQIHTGGGGGGGGGGGRT